MKVKKRRCSGKQVIGIGKVYRCNTELWHYEKKLCNGCLLNKFGLRDSKYDSAADPWCMTPLHEEDKVVMALRKASGL